MAGREHLSLVQDATGNGQQFFKTERGSLPCVPQQVTSKENTDNGAILQQPEGESVAPVTKVAVQIRRRHISHVPEDDVGKKDDKDGKVVTGKFHIKVDHGDQGCFESIRDLEQGDQGCFERIRDLEQENTELKITVSTLKSDKLELLTRLDVQVKERQTSEKTVLENNETICALNRSLAREEDEKTQMQEQIRTLEKDKLELTKRLDVKVKERQTSEKTIYELKRSLARANRRYQDSEDEQDRIRERMRLWPDALNRSLAREEDEKTQMQEKIRTLEKERDELKDELHWMNEAFDIKESDLTKKIDELKDELHELTKAHGELEKKKKFTENVKCVICLSARREVMFEPCGHLVCCASCAARMDVNCPMCRATIRRTHQVFF